MGGLLEIDPKRFYCGCGHRKATVAERSSVLATYSLGPDCPYTPRHKTTPSGKKTHGLIALIGSMLVPAEWIATDFGRQKDTRSACRKSDGFKKAEGDLFNLVPMIGELNGDSNSFLYDEDDKEIRAYGQYNFEIFI